MFPQRKGTLIFFEEVKEVPTDGGMECICTSKHRLWIAISRWDTAIRRQLVREKSLKPFLKELEVNVMLQFICGAMTGAVIGVAVMCLMQIHRLSGYDREADE